MIYCNRINLEQLANINPKFKLMSILDQSVLVQGLLFEAARGQSIRKEFPRSEFLPNSNTTLAT